MGLRGATSHLRHRGGLEDEMESITWSQCDGHGGWNSTRKAALMWD